MASSFANTVKFQVQEQVYWGQAINIQLHCMEYKGQCFQMECIEMEHKHVWESVPILFSPDLPDHETIRYRYFVAPFNCNRDLQSRRYLNWENTGQIMDLELKRSVCRESYNTIYDRREYISKTNIEKESENPSQQRITSKPMKQIVTINCTIKKQIPEGRWIYSMIMPNQLNLDDIDEDLFLRAQKMQRIRLKNTNKCLWKYTWILTLQEIEGFGHSMNIAFFNSTLYQRMKKYWTASLPDGKNRTIEQTARILQAEGIPYQFEIEDQSKKQSGTKVFKSKKNPDDILTLPTKFVYQVTDEIRQPSKIFCVCVVSEIFGRERMVRNQSNRKLWEIEIKINADQLQKLEYYFEINMIDQIENQIQVTHPAMIEGVLIGVPLVVHSCQPVIKSLKGFNFTGSTTNYYYNYDIPDYAPYRISSSYYWNHNNIQQIPARASRYGKYTRYYYPSCSGSSYSSRSYQVSSHTSPTRSERIVSTAQSISHNLTRICNKYHTVDLQTTSTSSTSTSSDRQWLVDNVRRVNHIVDSITNYNNQINSLIWKRDKLRDMDSETIKYIKVKDYLKPIKIKLVEKTEIQQIVDDFKKAKQTLSARYSTLSNKFSDLANFRNIGHSSTSDIISKNFGIFVIEIVAAVKDWAVYNFSDNKLQKIIEVVRKNIEFPESQDIGTQQTILTLFYFLYQHLISQHKILEEVQALGCQRCRQTQVMKAFYSPLIAKGFIKGKQTIEHNPIYKQMIRLIEYPFHEMKLLASQKGIVLQFSQNGDKLMHTLLAYAMIFSLSRHYWKEFPNFKPLPCQKFVQFCKQANPYTNEFKLSILLQIKANFVTQNKQTIEKLKQNEQQMIKMEEQVVESVQNAADKQLVELINIEFDLSRIRKQLEDKGKFEININMGDEADYEQQLEDIDNIIDEEQKCVKVRSLVNHKYLRAVAESQQKGSS